MDPRWPIGRSPKRHSEAAAAAGRISSAAFEEPAKTLDAR
jgi:hypothetical protein